MRSLWRQPLEGGPPVQITDFKSNVIFDFAWAAWASAVRNDGSGAPGVIGSVFILLSLLWYSWRLAANTKVFLREPPIAWYQKNAGWLLVLLEVILAGWIAYLIQKYVHPH